MNAAKVGQSDLCHEAPRAVKPAGERRLAWGSFWQVIQRCARVFTYLWCIVATCMKEHGYHVCKGLWAQGSQQVISRSGVNQVTINLSCQPARLRTTLRGCATLFNIPVIFA